MSGRCSHGKKNNPEGLMFVLVVQFRKVSKQQDQQQEEQEQETR